MHAGEMTVSFYFSIDNLGEDVHTKAHLHDGWVSWLLVASLETLTWLRQQDVDLFNYALA